MKQLEIDFNQLHHIENTVENQAHFEDNKEKFSRQCRKVYELMMQGNRLTTRSALLHHNIGDLRRRVKDLIDMWNVPVQSVKIKGNFKEYFINAN